MAELSGDEKVTVMVAALVALAVITLTITIGVYQGYKLSQQDNVVVHVDADVDVRTKRP